MGKPRKDNFTNNYMNDKLLRYINGYLRKECYNTLLLEVTIQDGVIQVIRTSEINDKKKL